MKNYKLMKIKVPQDVCISVKDNSLIIIGKMGVNTIKINFFLVLKRDFCLMLNSYVSNDLFLPLKTTYYSIIKKNILGVTRGFCTILFIQGPQFYFKEITDDGFLVIHLGTRLRFQVKIPVNIKIKNFKLKKLLIFGVNSSLVMNFAFYLRFYSKQDVYNGYGIYFLGESIIKKEKREKK